MHCILLRQCYVFKFFWVEMDDNIWGFYNEVMGEEKGSVIDPLNIALDNLDLFPLIFGTCEHKGDHTELWGLK